MPSLEEIKNLVDKLNPEQQIELAGYATKKWKEAKKSAEEILPILTLSSPFTDSDKAFVQQHEKNKKINFSKIKFAENIIEIDGLKFPRTVGTYNDVKDIPWLEIGTNVYQENGYDYFIVDAVRKLCAAGSQIPSKEQRAQAANVFGDDYNLLGQLLNYPKSGFFVPSYKMSDGVNKSATFWSSTLNDEEAFEVSFADFMSRSDSHPFRTNGWTYARSLVFLQD